MSSWPQPTPQRTAACKRSLLDLTKIRLQCPKCKVWFVQAGYRKHTEACQGLEPPPKVPHGHTLCECGRIKRTTAEKCSRCNGDVLAVDLEILFTREVKPEDQRKYFSVGLQKLNADCLSPVSGLNEQTCVSGVRK